MPWHGSERCPHAKPFFVLNVTVLLNVTSPHQSGYFVQIMELLLMTY
jgi:hypothetical protein